jgi:hypothetical protein
MEKYARIAVDVEPELRDRFQEFCKKHERTMTQQLRRMIKTSLSEDVQ